MTHVEIEKEILFSLQEMCYLKVNTNIDSVKVISKWFVPFDSVVSSW
jgi:hypothetical protein